MRSIICRRRIRLQQDINAAIHPGGWVDLRLRLVEDAYDPDSDEYKALIEGMMAEDTITTSE